MDLKEYQELAPKTASVDTEGTLARMRASFDLAHGVTGIATEAGELLEQMKKHLFYNKPLDMINVKEELGDILWYFALACKATGFTMEEIADANIAKLKARYPNGVFEEKFCHTRDVAAERVALGEVCTLCGGKQWIYSGKVNEYNGPCKRCNPNGERPHIDL
jgi:NTP pyrophosphatase (non-canonical NTP hydrolase)